MTVPVLCECCSTYIGHTKKRVMEYERNIHFVQLPKSAVSEQSLNSVFEQYKNFVHLRLKKGLGNKAEHNSLNIP